MKSIIEAQTLTKRYQDLVAVDGISFTVKQGECFGFLGPNGAGKTTLMKMLTCVAPVTSGELWVDEKDVSHNARAIKSCIGVVSQADSLDPDLTVMQNLLAFARFFNLPRAVARQRAEEALALFQLQDKASNRIDELSGGMRRRLLIARSLLHQPKLIVLDEPTTGLDPQTRHLVWQKIRALLAEGITILLTTHYMDEAAVLCDRLVVMDHGQILVEGTPRELIQKYIGESVVEVQVAQTHGDEKAQLLEQLEHAGFDVEDRGDVVCYGLQGEQAEPDVPLLDGYQCVRRSGNLEDVFLRLTGRGLRDE